MNTPVIFIGMHRSGTSMLGRLLEELGLFVGTQKEENNESIFFKDINNWIMEQCGARWDNPAVIAYLWGHEELLQWLEEYILQLLDSPRAMQFLGIRRYFSDGGITRMKIPWGWKDPRCTFTLPLWLRIFPNAKVINIKRHGVDVAQSLRVRSQKTFSATTKKYQRYKWIIPLRPKKGGFVDSPRCADLEGGLSLWKEYLCQAEKVLERIPSHRVLNLRYEDMLLNPLPNLISCAEFCGINASLEKAERLVSNIDPSRAYSYANDPELQRFGEQHKEALAEFGYGDA